MCSNGNSNEAEVCHTKPAAVRLSQLNRQARAQVVQQPAADRAERLVAQLRCVIQKIITQAATSRRVKLIQSAPGRMEEGQPREFDGEKLDLDTKIPLLQRDIHFGHKPEEEWCKRTTAPEEA